MSLMIINLVERPGNVLKINILNTKRRRL